MKADNTSAQTNGGDTAEAAGRTAIERQLGRHIDDLEWKYVRDRLIEFVRMLQSWDVRRKAPSSAEKEDFPRKAKQPAA